ncbi:hypothetical protein [Methanolobus bombayensis]|uniref:hypothetical protein n=1 Tax=Methanolobus bombayensis TaxID=38023 RepID=UPI001AE5B4F8|nr:hypothetical protein [Methanolobus bombayensis]MBP1908247.1 hypothetical protein [Methanolobus bombayensis]
MNKMFNIKKVTSHIFNAVIQGLIFGLTGTILIFAIIFIAISLFPTLKMFVPFTTENMELLNVSLTVVFVFVTSIYVYFTYQIVEQSSIDRKISFTEKKLVNFYYPLEDFMKFSVKAVGDEPNERELRRDSGLDTVEKRNSNPIYRDIVKNKYLADNETRAILDSFLDILSQNSRSKKPEHLSVYDNLNALVSLKIKSSLEELNSLLNEKK